jgi:molybdopterin-synthase adenylyltransferase
MKNIVIVGVGALGSHLVLNLRNIEGLIKVIDDDRVESKNLQSQFHTKSGLGKSKVTSLMQNMQFLYGVKLIGIPHRLTADNQKQLLWGADLIVDCVDNAATRVLIQEFGQKTSTPVLHGALAANGDYGRIVWSENFKVDSEAGAGAATCENGEFLPFIGLVSAYLAMAAQRFLADGKRVGFEISPAGTIFT